jgi:hypoxanthine phosphoribosyltransferase
MAMNMIQATLSFYTESENSWVVFKEFNDDEHLSNFIKYIHRTKGYNLDECWIEEDDNTEKKKP